MIDRRTLLGTLGGVTVSGVAHSVVSASRSARANPAEPAGGLIDLHSHFLPDFYVRDAVQAGIAFPDGMPKWPSWSIGEHLAMMDSCGVDSAVLSLSSPGVLLGDTAQAAALARRVNDFAAEVTSGQPRLGFFASLPLPNVVDSVVEAVRALDDLGADGVVMMSNAAGMYLGNAALSPLMAALHARSAVVFVHPTSPPNAAAVNLGLPASMMEFLFDTARTVVDLLMLGTIDRYPNIRWVLTHGGGVLPLLSDRVDFFRSQVGIKAPTMSDILQSMWFDLAGTPAPRQLPALVSAVGTEHLVYGSDFCFTPLDAVRQQIQSLDASTPSEVFANWRRATSDNARRLLGDI
ncbi:amidohydrolase family protein [Rhodococcus tibetensis]|uniref:6-methylsalicylate decarboxylase n=1 Tax=Rhodococcus tibetensis TaxID=2965064 RepID=A0ABT1QH89_9NOCA|nr:amidohydrolase family protein [Rhodococcus sp. FXJ9.536]MCQ4121033.1 amidohydrolase [Rhodococcus sp. FXJ9.536]